MDILAKTQMKYFGEDPDEMQHDAAFHQSTHCLLRLKQSSGTEIHNNLEILPVSPYST